MREHTFYERSVQTSWVVFVEKFFEVFVQVLEDQIQVFITVDHVEETEGEREKG